MSRVPEDETDGVSPCRVAREYIEGGLDEIAKGMWIARFNARGVVAPDPLMRVANRSVRLPSHTRSTQTRSGIALPALPRCLENMAQGYLRQGEYEDGEAEEFTDP